MKPIANLTINDLKLIKVLCFDCDGVTVKRGTSIIQDGLDLTIKVNQPSSDLISKMNRLKFKFHLVLNSGRSNLYLTQIYSGLLWDNVSFLSENGLFLLHQGLLSQNFQLNQYELDTIKKIRSELNTLSQTNKNIRGFEPKQFLTSLHCWQSVPEIEKIVFQSDYRHEFYCWWNDEAYDINPKRLNKGSGLLKLSQHLGLKSENIMTIGNGINDTDMARVDGLSISTDPDNHKADYYINGEELGGEILVDYLLKLSHL